MKGEEVFFIEYQYIVWDPPYEKFNEYPFKIIDYPENSSGDQRNDNRLNRNRYYSRVNTVKFKLCHEVCVLCQYLGNNKDPKCITCKFGLDESGRCIGFIY